MSRLISLAVKLGFALLLAFAQASSCYANGLSLEKMCDSLTPRSVEVTSSVKSEWTFADDSKKLYANRITFRRDDELFYVTETTQLEDGGSYRTDCLLKDGQIVRFQSDIAKDLTQNVLRAFIAPGLAGKSDASTPKPGDLLNMGTSFPVLGYLETNDIRDYFPIAASVVSQEDSTILYIRAETEFGDAEAWVDVAHGYLPQRIKIIKRPEHLTSGSRRVGDVLFDNKDPNSALTEVRLELTDVSYAQDPQGRYYISECRLTRETISKRGHELTTDTTWKVDKFTCDPDFGDGIRPDVAVADGDRFTLAGAPQLPYVWSENERWVVPADWALASDDAAPRRVRIGLLALLVAVLFCAVAYRRWGPGKVTAT